jgi:hypothetical protein
MKVSKMSKKQKCYRVRVNWEKQQEGNRYFTYLFSEQSEGDKFVDSLEKLQDQGFCVNYSCDYAYITTGDEAIKSLNPFMTAENLQRRVLM